MEWYKLAGIADIGNIVVHMDIRKENDNRGVIGLGEPPRDPDLRGDWQCGHQCDRRPGAEYSDDAGPRAGRTGREEGLNESFEYANPTTVQEAVGLLGTKWGQADVLAGGTDLISLMKDHLHEPKRVVNIKNIKELEGISKTADGLRIGALVTMDELAKNADVSRLVQVARRCRGRNSQPADPPHGDGRRRPLPAPPLLVLPPGTRTDGDEGRQVAHPRRREQVSLDLRRRARVLRQRVEPRTGADRAERAR